MPTTQIFGHLLMINIASHLFNSLPHIHDLNRLRKRHFENVVEEREKMMVNWRFLLFPQYSLPCILKIEIILLATISHLKIV